MGNTILYVKDLHCTLALLKSLPDKLLNLYLHQSYKFLLFYKKGIILIEAWKH